MENNNNGTKVSVVKASWGPEGDRLVCRWFEAREHAQHNLHWIHDASTDIHPKNFSPSVLDFTTFSPFGRANATFRIVDGQVFTVWRIHHGRNFI